MTLIFGILYSFVKPFYIVERIVPFSTRVSVHKLAAYADAGFLFKPGYMERGLKFRIWNVREYHLVRIRSRLFKYVAMCRYLPCFKFAARA